MNPDDEIVRWFFYVGALLSWAWVLLYLCRPWRTTPQGRALMVKSWGNTFLLTLGSVTTTFGTDWPGRQEVRLAGMALFVVGLAYLLWSLLTSPGAEDYPPRSWVRRRR